MRNPEFVGKLDRHASSLGTQTLWLAPEVRSVLWDWALKPVEPDATSQQCWNMIKVLDTLVDVRIRDPQ